MEQEFKISESCRVFKDVYIRDTVAGNAILSDRAVLISSKIADKVQIGRGCSIIHSSLGYGSFVAANSTIKFSRIGKYDNLSWDISIGGSNHNYKAACMYTDSWWKRTFGVGNGLEPVPEDDYTVVGNDVWIGAKANILRGVKIGDGAVIGANSLVLHDVPPYAIVVGSPARVIHYRFDERTISRLLAIKWWDWEPETIKESADYLRGDLNEEKLAMLEKIASTVK